MKNPAPILIASPVRRSGTTLLQRLLCSSSNSIIYGETCANEFQFFLQIYYSKQLFLSQGKIARDEILNKVLAGDVNDWIADLMPPVDNFMAELKQSCFGILDYLERFAAEQGRPIWGMKMAEWPALQLIQAQGFFPEIKLVYLRRNLLGCAQSARRVNMHINMAELQQYCQTWQQNYQQITQLFPPSQLLVLEYEQLLADPLKSLQQLEAFTGAKGIQASVLDHRINTFKSDLARAPQGDGYMEPGILSEEEINLVKRFESGQPGTV